MHIAGCVQRTLIIFILLAVTTSPSATQHTHISGSPLSSPTGTVTRVSSVVGGEAELPCDSRPPLRNDSLLLVVWYRDDDPVYSYDTRMPDPTAHWTEEAFSERARWVSSPSSGLRLHDVQARDRATYRCRVDFQVSPTRNYKIALDVIELPSKPVIFDEYGKEISGLAGPYNEGGDFKLICSVNGGMPTPRVQWLQADTVLATLGAGELQPSGMMRSLTLVVRNASRSQLSSIYTCTGDNTLLVPPQKVSIRVDLYLRPLTVEILSREQPLSVGRKTELWCRSTGARPPATVTWWLGGKKLESITKLADFGEVNETQSLLQWIPSKEHNGQVLICRAEHPKFNHSTIESKLPLNIYYVPEATIHLGAKMNPNDIEEGDDVYFGCEVDANPTAYKVVWEHNEVLLQNNPSNGIILTGNTNLALRNISRHQAGNYTCTASNVEGDGRSPPLHMQVVYKPLCRKREVKMIGAALQEPATVVCEVEAFPPPDTFEWTLNHSGVPFKVDSDRFTVEVNESKSILTYTPVADVDYGTLSCRATNLAGQQMSPCLYTLLPATRPDPPTNCTVYNLTHDSLDLLCLAGYEGGLHCVYVAEVWANEGLIVNASNAAALWNLRRLGAKRQLRLVVYAANAKGRSEHITFTVATAPRLSPRTEAQEAWEVNWAVGGVVGAAVTVAIILCLALIVTRLRHRSRDYEVTLPTLKNQKIIVPKRSSPHGQDDRNPDLIPLSKGVTDCPPDPPSYTAVAASALSKNSSSAHSLPRSQSPSTTITPHAHYIDSQSDSGRGGAKGAVRSHREVVTTRTPLLAAHQESYDTRMPDPTAHWTEEAFSERARWVSSPSSGLRLHDVQARDRATYRCRVDFQVSPTRNYKIALDVIELPSKPVIFDEYGKEISGLAGPYNEGGDFKLICSVNGGMPTPRVQWLQADTVLATLGAGELQPSGMMRSLTLVVRNASRSQLSSIYTCTGDNTLLVPPQKVSIRVDLYLRPLTVEILSREQPLSVGRKTELWCRSTGARPPATVTWWLGGKKLESITKFADFGEVNETQSLLQWIPSKEHNGQVLICRAEHPKFNHSTIESKLPLNIYYVPEATIHLGAKMNPNDIEEGDDVYFGCEVDANPTAYKVVWEHNEVLLQNNPSNGIILTGNTNLALRNISRHQAGNYTCTASNVEGDGRSPPLHMQVVYKPLCRKREVKMIGAALQEPATVVCEVEAFPPPDTFEWTLNHSGVPFKVDSDRFTVEVNESKSILTYTPVADVDYGTLSCRATNLAGQQMSPCLYTLLPATRPDPPTNCTVYNLTHDSLDLLCLAGYEGGLHCVYVAEVWANEGLIVNASNAAALWNLRRLGAKRQLRLVVYAANARGRSEHITFTVATAPRLSPRTEAQEAWEVNWAVGGVVGAAVTVAIILCLALIVTRLRHRSRDYEVTLPTLKNQKIIVPKRSSPHGQDDRNPDLIPLSKGSGVTDCPPDPPSYTAVAASALSKNSSSAHSLPRSQSPSTTITPHAHYIDSQSDSGRGGAKGAVRSHREVVTTRTPLLAAHQESCV